MTPRLLIRHLTGSMVHKVDQFALAGLKEVTLGRAPGNNVRFSGPHEDMVSRRHAVIEITRDGQTSFTIVDQNSSNGVRVNGRPVHDRQELLANTLVELGPGGPSFTLAVESAAPSPGQAAPAAATLTATAPPVAPARLAAGWRGTGTAACCIILGLAMVAGATVEREAVSHGCAWVGDQVRRALPDARPAAGNLPALPPAAAPATAAADPPAVTPHGPDVAGTPPAASDAVVLVEARWRLYDRSTGQPVYQKVVLRRGERLPCFVDTGDGRIVPWLTTADDDHTNTPVGGVVRGTGFIASSDGAIITGRHIAAGWTARYFALPALRRQAALFSTGSARTMRDPFRLVDLGALQDQNRPAAWIPGDGGTLFAAQRPVMIGSVEGNLEGRNEVLNVLLPSSHASTSARLVLVSPQADVAELRIDAGRQLPVLPLSPEPAARLGEAVTILGYPGATAVPLEQQDGTGGQVAAPLPPVLVAGTIAALPPASPAANAPAGLLRVAVPAGSAADGGPVIGPDGTTLGVVTADAADDAGHLSATPVQAARALLESR